MPHQDQASIDAAFKRMDAAFATMRKAFDENDTFFDQAFKELDEAFAELDGSTLKEVNISKTTLSRKWWQFWIPQSSVTITRSMKSKAKDAPDSEATKTD